MKRLNKEGPRVLHGFPRPELLGLNALDRHLHDGAIVIDTRKASDFAMAHVPGTVNIPLNGSFTTWAGWLVPFTRDFYLIVDDRAPGAADAAVRDLAMIGLDRVGGYFDCAVIDEWSAAGRRLGMIPQITVDDLRQSLARGAVTLIDVRNPNEWAEGHIATARHIPLGYLADRVDEIPQTKPIVLQCAAGARSAIAASLLRARGVEQVINLIGGMGEWRRAGHETVE
jgi:hydroxyacylglutathione hydrolase